MIINFEFFLRCDVLRMIRNVLSDFLLEGLEIVCSLLVLFSKFLGFDKFVLVLFFGIFFYVINFFNYC